MEAGANRRIAFTVQYDGSAYFGWQIQRGQSSVQGELERVLSRVFARPVRVIGSGRTDRGVHSTGQVAAVDAPANWVPADLRRAMNALLPDCVWIASAGFVASDFHPRYDARSRSYVYRIGLADVASSPFHARWCWPLGRALDLAAMKTAASALVGDHSFKAFAKAGQEERGHRCIVTEVAWREWEPIGVEFHISANRFLHHMVRYLVGTLVDVGLGRRPAGDLAALLTGDEVLSTSPPAPPEGLFLARVTYPPGAYEPEPGTNGPAGSLPPPIT